MLNKLKLKERTLYGIYFNDGPTIEWGEHIICAYYDTIEEALADLEAENGKKTKRYSSEEEVTLFFDEKTKRLEQYVLFTEENKTSAWDMPRKEEVILFKGEEYLQVEGFYYIALTQVPVWDISDDDILCRLEKEINKNEEKEGYQFRTQFFFSNGLGISVIRYGDEEGRKPESYYKAISAGAERGLYEMTIIKKGEIKSYEVEDIFDDYYDNDSWEKERKNLSDWEAEILCGLLYWGNNGHLTVEEVLKAAKIISKLGTQD